MPALQAGLPVLASHVPLGQAVLKRGIVFLNLFGLFDGTVAKLKGTLK